MSMHKRAALLSLALLAVALPAAVSAQTNSLAGTWTLNVAKSKYEPANLAATSSNVTYAFTGTSVTATIDQVNAKGQKAHITYTATLDGADSPYKGMIDGKPNMGQDAVSFKKLDANSYHVENKLKGKLTTTNHIVVAADGKSRTSTTTGTNADGVKIHNVAVYDKK